MIIFNSLKSHKFFVFGLIFSFCLCFIRPVSSYADDDHNPGLPGEFTYGCRKADGTVLDFTTNQNLNLFNLVSFGADYIASSHYDRIEFGNFVRDIGLDSFFANWSGHYPSFFVNVLRYVNSDFSCYVLDFRKDSFSDFTYHVTDHISEALISSSISMPSVYDDSPNFVFLSVPKNFYLSYQQSSDPFYLVNLGYSNLSYNTSGSFSSGGVTYPYKVSTVLSGVFSDFCYFLSSDDIYSFCVCYFDSASNPSVYHSFYAYNLGYRLNYRSSFTLECFLSTFYSYRFDSPIMYLGEPITSKNLFGSYYYLDKSNDPNWVSIYDLTNFFFRGMSYSGTNPSLPTPTPIPSPEWVTPTPLPTVTPVPITLTPIPQYINPDLVIDSTEVKSALSGYLDIIDDTFSNFAIFSLGSQVLSYLYSFSSYFSFVLLIPAICLIAYAIGRLNQK